jgi:hypothetical protein
MKRILFEIEIEIDKRIIIFGNFGKQEPHQDYAIILEFHSRSVSR